MKLQLSQSLKNLGNILCLLSWILPQRNPLGIWTCVVVDDEDGDEEQGAGGREEERGRGREMKKVMMESTVMDLVAMVVMVVVMVVMVVIMMIMVAMVVTMT